MTHVEMQAVLTMLNLKINIVTTGITPERSNTCNRCNRRKQFATGDDLREHNKNVHNKIETREEREGRVKMARWTELKPDNRIRNIVPKEKEETVFLLHNDDIHYNMIVHRSHNAFNKENSFKEHIEKPHDSQKNIFGDTMKPQVPQTWAQVTSANIKDQIKNPIDTTLTKPINKHKTEIHSTEEVVEIQETDDEGWMKVKHKGNMVPQRNKPIKEKIPEVFKVPT